MTKSVDSSKQRALLEKVISRHRDFYLVIDCETTGPARDWDLVYELGYCLMDRGECVTEGEILLNWADHPDVNENWLRDRMAAVAERMKQNGGTFSGSIERMRQEGIKPELGLRKYLQLLRQVRKSNGYFVGHNAWAFDVKFLQNQLREYLGSMFTFRDDEVMDTGAIEKGAMLGQMPKPDDTPKSYFSRVCATRAAGVKWSIDHCVKKYGLAERYGLDMSMAHRAGFDAAVTAILFEEFRAGADNG